MNDQIAKLEVRRVRLHDYILMKLEERDYHAIQDAGSDLRELDVAVRMLEDEYKRSQATNYSAGLLSINKLRENT
jgi:hypothetical protein